MKTLLLAILIVFIAVLLIGVVTVYFGPKVAMGMQVFIGLVGLVKVLLDAIS